MNRQINTLIHYFNVNSISIVTNNACCFRSDLVSKMTYLTDNLITISIMYSILVAQLLSTVE